MFFTPQAVEKNSFGKIKFWQGYSTLSSRIRMFYLVLQAFFDVPTVFIFQAESVSRPKPFK